MPPDVKRLGEPSMMEADTGQKGKDRQCERKCAPGKWPGIRHSPQKHVNALSFCVQGVENGFSERARL